MITLRDDVFVALTTKLGADSDAARARLLGVDRNTIYRMRTGRFLPNLSNAIRMAEVLDTTVEELFEQVAA